MNGLSVNLHLMMVSFYQPSSKRTKIICEAKAFPSDQYMLESQVKFHGLNPDDTIIEVSPRDGEHTIREEDILSTIEEVGEELALVFWGGVNYYSGQVFDMAKITEKAHAQGAYVGFDLAHGVGTNSSKLSSLKDFLKDSDIGLEGINEFSQVVNQLEEIQLLCATLDIDVTLARGLNYYTGAIFEVEAKDVSIGSIGGGGRYDDLTGIFGFENMSGVGISFGFDRICIVLEALDLFPKFTEKGTQVLFVNFGKDEANYCLNLLKKLRSEGIKSEIYPSATKMKKQMQYADRKNVEYVLLVGENEMKTNTITVKNMFDGSQKNMTFEQLLLTIK